VHNDNEDLTITEVTIAVWDKSDPESLQSHARRIRVGPLASEATNYRVVYTGEESEWTWKIESAMGQTM
jgi:hypothetical protein